MAIGRRNRQIEGECPDDEEKADAVLARLEAGEDFMFVALEVTLAPSAVEVDWFVRDGEPTVFEGVQDQFFSLEVGELSSVIPQRDFFYIIEVLEREESRALDDAQRESIADRELADCVESDGGFVQKEDVGLVQ